MSIASLAYLADIDMCGALVKRVLSDDCPATQWQMLGVPLKNQGPFLMKYIFRIALRLRVFFIVYGGGRSG